MRGAGGGLRAWRARLASAVATLAAAILAVPATALAAGGPWGNGYVPNVSVVDQDGRTLKFYDDLIKDKIVVVSFIYTTCKDICPLVTARLGLLQERLGERVGRDIHFVSVSIDPERDTPERLKAHAEAFRTGPGWTFVTGRPEDIAQIRYKLGERSRELNEHRNDVMLGNDRTGQWARDSVFADLGILTVNVLNMDPAIRQASTAIATATASAPAGRQADEPGRILFTKTCASCHTIGRGDRIGPDLAGVLQRRERDWVERYLAEPERVRGAQDPAAVELSRRFGAVRMPNLGLSEADIADLMSFIGSASASGHALASSGGAHQH